MQQLHLQQPSTAIGRGHPSARLACPKPLQGRPGPHKAERQLRAKSRWEISTTEDPAALSDEIARLQRENELMQQLLSRQGQPAETGQAAKSPGQASSGAALSLASPSMSKSSLERTELVFHRVRGTQKVFIHTKQTAIQTDVWLLGCVHA